MDFMQWAAEEAQKAYEQARQDFMETYHQTIAIYDQNMDQLQIFINQQQPVVDDIEQKTAVIELNGLTICKQGDSYVSTDQKGNPLEIIQDRELIDQIQEEELSLNAQGLELRSGEDNFTVKKLERAKILYEEGEKNKANAADTYHSIENDEYDTNEILIKTKEMKQTVDEYDKNVKDFNKMEYSNKLAPRENTHRHEIAIKSPETANALGALI